MLTLRQINNLKKGDTLYWYRSWGGYLGNPITLELDKFQLTGVTAKMVLHNSVQATGWRVTTRKADLVKYSLSRKAALKDMRKRTRESIASLRKSINHNLQLIKKIDQKIREVA